jgi:multidrug transporter EmrE-like cation transporter
VPLSALALVVLAGLIHASWNIAAKKAGGDARFAFFTSVVLMGVWAPVGLWAAWGVLPDWGWTEWSVVALSGVLHVLYYIVLLRGYRKADLTVVYPLARGSGPLLSSMVAILLLGEQISALGLFGILGVVGGVFLIAGGPGLLRAAHDPAQRQRVHKGMAYGLLTGAFIASYTVVDGYAVKVSSGSHCWRPRCCATARPRACCGAGSGNTRCWSAPSARCPMCWCCMRCRWRRCRMWRRRARCPCCLPR